MYKSVLILASLTLGTAAIAQDAPQSTAPSAQTTTPDAAASAMPADNGTSNTSTAVDQAAPPAATSAPAATTEDTSNYPACSRAVTDKCVQKGARHSPRK